MASIPGPRRWLVAAVLALSPLASLADKSAAEYFVRNLPGVPEDQAPVKMHAGHIEITPESNGNLFFWHFQNKHIANKQRTIIWVNGGPGCSSEDGAMMEIGPYRLKDTNTLVPNNGSWNEFANLLFVDNPVGTGFSYANTDSYVHELTEMARQFVVFLEKFFAIFPEYSRDDIYIAGESYAGQYIPYISRAILDRNKERPDKWSLQGILLGNPWMSPNEQYDSYLKFAFEKGLIDKDSSEAEKLKGAQRNCHTMMASDPGKVTYSDCEDILTEILFASRKGGGGNDGECFNMYDVRLKDSYPSCGMNWPPDLASVAPYLRRDDVVHALNINPEKKTGWQECNGGVSVAFKPKTSKPSVELMPQLLSEIPVLIFSGAEDLICNHIGTEDMIDKLEWNGGKGFEVTPGNWAPRRNWTFEGKDAGFWQSARNLTYVVFREASHMVPFDYPRRSRDMVDRFMGVDIRSIGGSPADSRIDGEKGLETTVGGSANPKASEEAVKQKLKEAKWAAYRRSGEVVLVFVVLGALGFVFFVWRQRRKGAAYSALRSEEPMASARRRHADAGDIEAQEEGIALQSNILPADKYSVGDDSDDEGAASPSKGKQASRPHDET
ncbi:pheromone processing carboxypeptidase KexA [Cordyceps fumosorosea ARSEF 2679]|uniref:Carboxypeptidase n=1 Tax=Cordyceps fumosorosea (strain ARSEF 2679) TaxID=1081104 RepID=A0A167NDH4_CORFA|nr:pheromone processing carboxypeptidase KexA [Cordyceps fumosorosea ARSEF 2679]OAA55432.1 pheromone processing carboxypeptidase KexA [Cordyceps fumosorosea ARSEF 2679]